MINYFFENLIVTLVLLSNLFIGLGILLILGEKVSVKIKAIKNKFFEFVNEDLLWIAFAVSFMATIGSLFYSEIMNYNPCILCWYQRILMYPQVIFFGIAALRKDSKVFVYSFALSIIGVAIALFHYIVQMGQLEIIACDALGYSAKCTEMVAVHLGYITIPWMSLSAFAMLIFLFNLNKNN